MADAPPSAEALNARVLLTHGSTLGKERILLDYTASGLTGNRSVVIPMEIAANATDQSLNLASYVDTATIIAVRDRGSTGIKVGLASGGTKAQIAANKFWSYENGNATPPTLYFDNVSAADKAYFDVYVLGNSA